MTYHYGMRYIYIQMTHFVGVHRPELARSKFTQNENETSSLLLKNTLGNFGQFGCAFTHITLGENAGNEVAMLTLTVMSAVEMSTLAVNCISSVRLCIISTPGMV